MSPVPLAATLALACLAAAAVPAPGAPRLPAPWTHRVLLVSAPDAADDLLRRQRTTFAAMGAGARERDLVLVEAVGMNPSAVALRRRFGLDPAGFEVVLIGKDGGEKRRAATVLGSAELFPLIDAMPMRQQEMRRQDDPANDKSGDRGLPSRP